MWGETVRSPACQEGSESTGCGWLPCPLFLSQAIQKEVKAHVKEAVEFALDSEFSSAKELYTHVYTETDTVTRARGCDLFTDSQIVSA